MSGALKSGLLFGAGGLILVIAISFVPVVGPFLCGPIAAGVIGTAAGYFGVRWSPPTAGVGTGVLSGVIAGLLLAVGSIIFFLIAVAIAQTNPALQETIRDAIQQQPDAQISPEDAESLLGVGAFVAGLCFGLVNLVLALGLGALGGWLAVRNRPQTPQYAEQPPMGPPPMSPGV